MLDGLARRKFYKGYSMKFELHHGDCLKLLASMPERSIDCCVTSPPYFGLRDYGTAEWEGGDPGCDHSVGGQVQDNKAPVAIVFGVRPGCDASKCKKCGAVRVDSQIGLEPTPGEFVAKLVAVFREVRRVLRDDGTLWLNLGDSYASGKGTCYNPGGGDSSLGKERKRAGAHPLNRGNKSDLTAQGLKPKDLIGIPWRVAFALQADGWYLRQDIIWHKPNPMPESVKDRCTKAHEYVFLLSKSARYYFDNESIKEPCSEATHERAKYRWKRAQNGGGSKESMQGHNYDNDFGDMAVDLEKGKNKRSVWTVNTKPYKGAHFATFPPALIEPCVLAGSRKGGVVLDPFNGSGTTGEVAILNGRRYVGIELNAAYIKLAETRIDAAVKQSSGLLFQ
jgi:DNA modification methylase